MLYHFKREPIYDEESRPLVVRVDQIEAIEGRGDGASVGVQMCSGTWYVVLADYDELVGAWREDLGLITRVFLPKQVP